MPRAKSHPEPPPADALDLMNLDQVAAELRIGRRQLLNLRAARKGPTMFRLGREVVAHRADVARYVLECKEADQRKREGQSR